MFLFFVLVTAARLCPQSELFKEILVNFFVELLTTILVPYICIYSIYIISKIAYEIKSFNNNKWRAANASFFEAIILFSAHESDLQLSVGHNDNLIDDPPHQLIIIPLQRHRLPVNRLQHSL